MNKKRNLDLNPLARRLWHGQTVALLGGSFNPAHEGHFHIARLALQKLDPDAVWWLVSPQNPLKSAADMALFQKRYESALGQARHPKMIVTDIEGKLGTRYTADTIKKLKQRFPTTNFIWIMGEDNLATLEKWQKWKDIFRMVNVAIFHRRYFATTRIVLKPLKKLAFRKMRADKARVLKQRKNGKKFVMLYSRLHSKSSTQIRRQGQWK